MTEGETPDKQDSAPIETGDKGITKMVEGLQPEIKTTIPDDATPAQNLEGESLNPLPVEQPGEGEAESNTPKETNESFRLDNETIRDYVYMLRNEIANSNIIAKVQLELLDRNNQLLTELLNTLKPTKETNPSDKIIGSDQSPIEPQKTSPTSNSPLDNQ